MSLYLQKLLISTIQWDVSQNYLIVYSKKRLCFHKCDSISVVQVLWHYLAKQEIIPLEEKKVNHNLIQGVRMK